MIDHNDITELKKVFDDRYVMQSDCNEIQIANNKKFAYDDKRIEQQESFISGLKKFGWAILGVLLGEVAVSLLTLLK